MKKIYFQYKKILPIILIIFSTQGVLAQTSEPFNCVTEAYLFQSNDVYAQNLASGLASLDGINLTNDVINGVGYNPKDGYIWGSLKSPANTLVRVGNNYEVTTFTVANAPYSYVGDVNQDGIYYLKNGSSGLYKVDLDPESPTYLTNIGTMTLSKAISNHDWAFNAADNMLYTVEKHSNKLYKIDPDTGNVQDLGEVPILSGLNYTYGAVYFDVDGNFYISANQTGTVYVIYSVQNVTSSADMQSNFFAFGPSSSQNDGARCPTAPVPQEDCTNGIDDDGDGLVDCDDPSCSGVAACPEITPTSTGNKGGLESNNRLSQQINQRNLNRLKANYKFDRAAAKRIFKRPTYGKKSSNVSLWDFIPMDILQGTSVIESSPADLADITNAVEVLSVDYITPNNEGLGTILVLETESSVYEHTKHICDRFTGSELLSVSNMEINDEVFIKSIVKRPDGGIEYVASFSVAESEDKTSYIVESHWNLDKYSSKGFYNFQIWASSIDDLYNLSQEVLRLLSVQKSISSYISSEAPPVFVRKANYNSGKIDLEIVSTIGATTISIDGNKRATETSSTENIQFSIDLEGTLNNVTLDTQNLYDFGFRISNEFDATPDDLFLSDGTWGIDYSSEPFLSNFTVAQNTEGFGADDLGVERSIIANFMANQDVSIYRSLTPKFEQVDVSDYNSLSFLAKGTGQLKVILVRESISAWEDQPNITIDLTSTEQEHIISLSDLIVSAKQANNGLNDIKTLFFTLLSDGGITENKTLELSNVKFSKSATASVDDVITKNKVKVMPNPVADVTQLVFSSDINSELEFEVYNIFGKQVHKETYNANAGSNSLEFRRNKLASGMYFFKIYSGKKEWSGKLILK